jgi:hypothetical protein
LICSDPSLSGSNKLASVCLQDQNSVCAQDYDCANQLKCQSGKCSCAQGFEEFNQRTHSCEMVRYKNERNHCYSTSDCKSYNLACDRSANGNRTNSCVRVIGEFCQSTSDCVNGLNCEFNTCQCNPKTQYYDYTEHDCVFKRSLRESCLLSYQCGERLVCDSRRSFACLKSYGTQCRNTSECANYLECLDGICGCSVNNFLEIF